MSFDLEAYLADKKQVVEQLLQQALPTPTPPAEALHTAMRYAVLNGGKRLRPILCLAAAEVAGGITPAVHAAATAVELLHSYTLVHDDLPCMDNDLWRRGQPTVHAKHGETLAVLSGDALLTLAFQVLPANNLHPLLVELTTAAGHAGVIAGQVADLQHAKQPDRATIEYVFQHKTADLFMAAARMGVIAAQGDALTLAQITAYAQHLGFAFQIIDDLLDRDNLHNTAQPELSCLKVMSVAEARTWAQTHTTQALAALKPLNTDTAVLASLASHLLQRII